MIKLPVSLFAALLLLSTSAIAQSQTKAKIIIPEFEKIIVDAEKAGINPLQIARDNKEKNIWTMKDYIQFSKYNRDKQDEKLFEAKTEQAQARKQLFDQSVQIVEIFTDLKKSGKFTQKEAAIITEIYNDPYSSPETKQLIKERFPDLFPLK